MASSIFTSADGQALTSIFFLDISARVQTEAALQRLAAIDASTDDAIISADLAGNVMSWNQGAEKLYGYYAAEAIGRPLTALIVPEQSQNFERYIDLFRHGEPILRTEATHRHKEGYAIGVIMTISPIKNAEEQIIGVSLIARDITEYKRIQDETDRLAAIVESAQDAIVSINFDGKITSWNHSAERIYGHPAAAVMGTSLFALLAPGQTVNMQPMLDRIRQGETIPLPDLTWQTPAGHNLVLAVTLGPVKNRTGAMIGAASAPPPCRAVAIL